MSFEFNVDEVLEMAINIEKTGAAFYRKAAETVDEPYISKFLQDLAAMEDEHIEIFSKFKSELTQGEKGATTFDPQNEALDYLRALAETRVFFEKEMNTSSIEEIFKSAMKVEKDSIVFYLGMKDMVSQKHGKERIETILQEEMMHVKIIHEHFQNFLK